MARYRYIDKRFAPASQQIIDQANEICAEYARQGFRLTLRQVYYQFVARGLMANKQTNYDRLGSILSDARMAGQLDWSYMEDRTRNLKGGSGGYTSPQEYLAEMADGYFIDLWEGQDAHIEVWIEKDALVGVIEPACWRNRIGYFSCRGYTSQSEMRQAAMRFLDAIGDGKHIVVIHLGDHDPSGIDMTRDIIERLQLFIEGHTDRWTAEDHVDIMRIALNMDQIRQYDPPPNPAKFTDSRASAYVAKYGRSSWELDALEPSVMDTLIQAQINDIRDAGQWNARIAQENAEKQQLRDLALRLEDETLS